MITRLFRTTLLLTALPPLAGNPVLAGQVPIPTQGGIPAPMEQLRNQAIAAKRPGGNPASETNALLGQLTRKHSGKIEAENARIKARFPSSLAPPPGGGASLGTSGNSSGAASPSSPQMHVMDPCPNSVELKAWQGTPPLDPGEFIVLDGCGFGIQSTGAEVRLAGDFPGGHLKLNVSSWGVTRIMATVPMVTGVVDMPAAKLQVIHSSGRFSNMLDVGGFRATREVRKIHPTDVVMTCAPGSAQQECSFAQSHPLSQTNFYGGATFAARHHRVAAGDCPSSASEKLGLTQDKGGSDRAAVNLKNGWVLDGYAWWWENDGGYGGYVQAPAGFAVDSNTATIEIRWGVFVNPCFDNDGTVRYRVDLYAAGPKGVPYK